MKAREQHEYVDCPDKVCVIWTTHHKHWEENNRNRDNNTGKISQVLINEVGVKMDLV